MTPGKTPLRSIRIPDELWAEVQSQAAREGIDASTLIRQLLRGWLDSHELEGENK